MKLPATHPMQLVLGLIVWIAWFVLIYAALSIGCVVAPPPLEAGALTWINAAILASTVLVSLLLLLFANQCRRAMAHVEAGTERFICGVGAGAYLSSALLTLVVGLPVVALPPCI